MSNDPADADRAEAQRALEQMESAKLRLDAAVERTRAELSGARPEGHQPAEFQAALERAMAELDAAKAEAYAHLEAARAELEKRVGDQPDQ